MKRLLCVSALALLAATGAMAAEQGQTLKQAQCDALWMKANPDKAEKIPETTAAAFVTDVKTVNPDGDTTIEQDEFAKACSQGLIKKNVAAAWLGTDATTGPTTSDRTPGEEASTPAEQKDVIGGETSDRTPGNE